MSCEIKDNCQNFPSGCWLCRYNKDLPFPGKENKYWAINEKIEHPDVVREKEERKEAKKAANRAKKQSRDLKRSSLVKKAAKIENKVKATLNSGRVNNDGDLKTDDLVIDVKSQSTRINPEIDINEFDKCNRDALRAGKKHGVLIIENKDGRRFVVMSEDLFSEGFI